MIYNQSIFVYLFLSWSSWYKCYTIFIHSNHAVYQTTEYASASVETILYAIVGAADLLNANSLKKTSLIF